MLNDKEAVKSLLRKYNLSPNFTYGQNFLTDEEVLEHMVEAAKVSGADVVLEVGPGIGNLTRVLCEKAGFVLSVEKDPKFYPILRSIKKDFKDKFRFEMSDILEFDFVESLRSCSLNEAIETKTDMRPRSVDSTGAFPSYKVIANIPYYITGKILQLFLTAKNKPSSITVLTQKEVAENVTASAGELSLLAISVQLFGTPKIVEVVPKKSFFPSPKVDSAVLHIEIFDKPVYKILDEKKFFKIVKACFAGKRKQIHNTLVNNLRLEKEAVNKILLDIKIDPSARPQELSIDDWVRLVDKI